MKGAKLVSRVLFHNILGFDFFIRNNDLGLSLVKRIIDLSNGFIRVESKINQGAIAKILDTSIIIDGRIADICASGRESNQGVLI